MATGSLRLRVSDLLDEPIAGTITVDLEPAGNSPGGTRMHAEFVNDAAVDFIIEGIQCRGGPGSLYLVRIFTRNFRVYGFFQMILENRVNLPSDNHIRLVVNPKRVKNITAPEFAQLPGPLRAFLDTAEMKAPGAEDRDLLGLRGRALYSALGRLRQACLLNIFTKASHASAESCFHFMRSVLVLRQDRCFCTVDAGMPEFLRKSPRFKSAPNTLHRPLDQFVLEDSFKSRDDHANLQVTFMRHAQTGELAADVDIDEAMGIEHGFEVIRNAITSGRTNPFLIRELMLLFDPVEKVLDPGYGFVFG